MKKILGLGFGVNIANKRYKEGIIFPPPYTKMR